MLPLGTRTGFGAEPLLPSLPLEMVIGLAQGLKEEKRVLKQMRADANTVDEELETKYYKMLETMTQLSSLREGVKTKLKEVRPEQRTAIKRAYEMSIQGITHLGNVISYLKAKPELLVGYLECRDSDELQQFMNELPCFYFDYTEVRGYAEFLSIFFLRKHDKGGFVEYQKNPDFRSMFNSLIWESDCISFSQGILEELVNDIKQLKKPTDDNNDSETQVNRSTNGYPTQSFKQSLDTTLDTSSSALGVPSQSQTLPKSSGKYISASSIKIFTGTENSPVIKSYRETLETYFKEHFSAQLWAKSIRSNDQLSSKVMKSFESIVTSYTNSSTGLLQDSYDESLRGHHSSMGDKGSLLLKDFKRLEPDVWPFSGADSDRLIDKWSKKISVDLAAHIPPKMACMIGTFWKVYGNDPSYRSATFRMLNDLLFKVWLKNMVPIVNVNSGFVYQMSVQERLYISNFLDILHEKLTSFKGDLDAGFEGPEFPMSPTFSQTNSSVYSQEELSSPAKPPKLSMTKSHIGRESLVVPETFPYHLFMVACYTSLSDYTSKLKERVTQDYLVQVNYSFQAISCKTLVSLCQYFVNLEVNPQESHEDGGQQKHLPADLEALPKKKKEILAALGRLEKYVVDEVTKKQLANLFVVFSKKRVTESVDRVAKKGIELSEAFFNAKEKLNRRDQGLSQEDEEAKKAESQKLPENQIEMEVQRKNSADLAVGGTNAEASTINKLIQQRKIMFSEFDEIDLGLVSLIRDYLRSIDLNYIEASKSYYRDHFTFKGLLKRDKLNKKFTKMTKIDMGLEHTAPNYSAELSADYIYHKLNELDEDIILTTSDNQTKSTLESHLPNTRFKKTMITPTTLEANDDETIDLIADDPGFSRTHRLTLGKDIVDMLQVMVSSKTKAVAPGQSSLTQSAAHLKVSCMTSNMNDPAPSQSAITDTGSRLVRYICYINLENQILTQYFHGLSVCLARSRETFSNKYIIPFEIGMKFGLEALEKMTAFLFVEKTLKDLKDMKVRIFEDGEDGIEVVGSGESRTSISASASKSFSTVSGNPSLLSRATFHVSSKLEGMFRNEAANVNTNLGNPPNGAAPPPPKGIEINNIEDLFSYLKNSKDLKDFTKMGSDTKGFKHALHKLLMLLKTHAVQSFERSGFAVSLGLNPSFVLLVEQGVFDAISSRIFLDFVSKRPTTKDFCFFMRSRSLRFLTLIDLVQKPSQEKNLKYLSKYLEDVILKLRSIDEGGSVFLVIKCVEQALMVISDLFHIVLGSKSPAGAEDIVPIFLYCLVKAELQRAQSIFYFIDLMMAKEERRGKDGFNFTQIETGINFIEAVDYRSFPVDEATFTQNIMASEIRAGIHQYRRRQQDVYEEKPFSVEPDLKLF